MPREKSQAAKLSEAIVLREQRCLAAVMSTEDGRAFVWKVLSDAGIYHSTYVPDSDASQFNEGRRSVGLGLFHDIQVACPAAFLTMTAEAERRAQADREAQQQLEEPQE